MKHLAGPSFWKAYRKLPKIIQQSADKSFDVLKENPDHASLHLKKVRKYWSVRVGLRHRALGVEIDDGVLWFWIGNHAEYDKLVK